MRPANKSKSRSRIMQADSLTRFIEASEMRRRRHRSEAMRKLLAKCPEHLFSTDNDELKPIH